MSTSLRVYDVLIVQSPAGTQHNALPSHRRPPITQSLYWGRDEACRGSRSVADVLPASIPRRPARMRHSGLPDTQIGLPWVGLLSSFLPV